MDGDTLALIYTGHKFHGDPSDEENLYQVQCLATSRDGIHFERQGMVLDTPPGLHHFRDPKVARRRQLVHDRRRPRRRYRVRCACTARTICISGMRKGPRRSGREDGLYVECPDFFTLGDKHVLMFSPQGLAAQGYENRNLFQSGYLLGDWQSGQRFAREGQFVEMDHGHDFYAPQSFRNARRPSYRHRLAGYVGITDAGTAGRLGRNALSPRELSLSEDNRLQMRPAKEVECLRRAWFPWPVSTVKNQQLLMVENCDAMEVILHWDCANSTAEQYGLSFGDGLRVYVDAQMQRLVLERHYPQYGLCGVRSVPLHRRRAAETAPVL